MAILNIEQIRSVQWGKTYLWDIAFPNENSNTSYLDNTTGLRDSINIGDWFPAISVEDTTAIIESEAIPLPMSETKIAKNSAIKSIRISFADDIYNTVYNWFDSWMNEIILNNNEYVGYLSDYYKKIYIRKLNTNKDVINESVYLVYPEDTLIFLGNSESGLPEYSVNLIKVGYIYLNKGDSMTGLDSSIYNPNQNRSIFIS